ncbi:MAG: hypothetical protein AB7L65_10525 [Hyphomonadaceae bacterium]
MDLSDREIELLRCAADQNRRLPHWVSEKTEKGALEGVHIAMQLQGKRLIEGCTPKAMCSDITITPEGKAYLEGNPDEGASD